MSKSTYVQYVIFDGWLELYRSDCSLYVKKGAALGAKVLLSVGLAAAGFFPIVASQHTASSAECPST